MSQEVNMKLNVDSKQAQKNVGAVNEKLKDSDNELQILAVRKRKSKSLDHVNGKVRKQSSSMNKSAKKQKVNHVYVI